MLSIRFQRTGRRGQAKFRVVVQDSRRSPTSGRVVANLGHYNPHSKDHGVDFDRLVVYLKNGAQPSSRVAHLLTTNKIDLPAWVKTPDPRQRPIRHPQKLRRNRSDEAVEEAAANETPPADEETPKDETAAESSGSEADDKPAADEAQEQAEDQADPETAALDPEPAKDQPPAEESEDSPAASEQDKGEKESEDAAEPPAKSSGKDQDDSAAAKTKESK